MTEALFDVPPDAPVGSVRAALYYVGQALRGRRGRVDAMTRAEAELSAVVAREAKVAAARDAEVSVPAEGKVARSPRASSARAARLVEPKTGTQRARILDHLVLVGAATDHDLVRALGIGESSVRPRRGELVDAGYVVDSGETTHYQPNGPTWTVWKPTDAARSWHRRARESA
ncbi:hypothetical protein [Amycolatopsis sp. CA-230715]|uniref:hypothetical protein n=1 Tax=Amycolatopsis sp. CA-230715 TaxID=2745196 RepID=UPI001C013E0A|nr:hypothetical protein [Amycolatopsis sp. CA-230715]QWF81159.1 hypothetical protein HUW46_04585 [Amycolatopsis sp. CA-230715]